MNRGLVTILVIPAVLYGLNAAGTHAMSREAEASVERAAFAESLSNESIGLAFFATGTVLNIEVGSNVVLCDERLASGFVDEIRSAGFTRIDCMGEDAGGHTVLISKKIEPKAAPKFEPTPQPKPVPRPSRLDWRVYLQTDG